jgi:hypothetical protein
VSLWQVKSRLLHSDVIPMAPKRQLETLSRAGMSHIWGPGGHPVDSPDSTVLGGSQIGNGSTPGG